MTDGEFEKLPRFSVDLEEHAAELMKTRADFTFEELANFAFRREFDKWQKRLKSE